MSSSQDRRSLAQRHPRHPAEVTSDRLAAALEKWPHMFDGGERDMIAQIRHVLYVIAECGGQSS
jgi:hypothetical protein